MVRSGEACCYINVRGKRVFRERRDLTYSERGNGLLGRDVMLQKYKRLVVGGERRDFTGTVRGKVVFRDRPDVTYSERGKCVVGERRDVTHSARRNVFVW